MDSIERPPHPNPLPGGRGRGSRNGPLHPLGRLQGRWLVALVLTALHALGATAAPAVTLGEKELESCHLPNFRQEVLCGDHTVFEDRAAASGRELEIRFAVLPAVGENPLADPVVIFAGGPGQAAMEMAPFIRQVFNEISESRDIVLIDQRGMGSSAALDCEAAREVAEQELDLGPQEVEELTRTTIRQCLDQWDADVTLYTQDLANEDIHEILLALGYDKVNLFGASWGTRSALLYAHRYPEHVRTVVLDGALPPENMAPLHAAMDGDRALKALFAACAADLACHDAFPALEDEFRRALDRLGPSGDPATGTGAEGSRITVPHPFTGEPESVVLTPQTFGGLLRNILYSPELSRVIPWIIHRAADGDYRPLVGVSSFLQSASGDSMTLGGSLAIFCAEELGRAGDSEPDDTEPDDTEPDEETLIGHALLDGLRNACSVWPKTTVPALYAEPIGSDAPALVLSGEVDPITPPQWGEAMTRLLPNGRHLVAPATGHNVSPVGCAADLIAQFIDQANAQVLDPSCLDTIERPSFFIDASGPSMARTDGAHGTDGTDGTDEGGQS